MANMQEKTIFELLIGQYMIVPEIQREYVWGSEENKEKCKNLLEDIIKNEKGYNVGFLYSYDEDNKSDNHKEVHLIDGQQRFTTLYLTLFYLYVKCGKLNDNDNKEIFKKFSYRVRNLTKEFVNIMIDKVKTVKDLHDISNRTWYLSVYRHDPTIKNIVNLFTIFNDKSDEDFIDKLINNLEKIENTKFYYFNTSQTSQGEELYITMNSRGEQIAVYEDARVILLEKVKENKLEKSKIFNEIEHFFWRHRKENEDSSDRGFERFLKQTIGLKKLDNIDELENNTIGIVENYDIKKDIHNIELEEIIEYYYCLKVLFKALDDYKKNNYNDYIKSLYKEDKINKDILEYDSFIITILYIIKNIFKIYDKNEIYECNRETLENKINKFNDFENLFQWIRFIYNMKYNYKNNLIVNIIKAIKNCEDVNIFESFKNCYNDYNDNDLLNYFLNYDGVIGFEADENYYKKSDKFDIVKNEILKIKFLYYINNNNFKDLQKQFWELENHPISSGNINYIIKYALESNNKENFVSEFNLYKNIFENCFKLIKQEETQKTFIKILLIKAIDLDNNKDIKDLENKWFIESHAIHKSFSNSYSVHLFSFCNNEEDWSKSFQYDYYRGKEVSFYYGKLVGYNTNKVYELLFKELKENNIQNIEEYFNKKIEEFINQKTYKDYVKNYFLKIIDENYKNGNGKSILDFAKQKCFAYNRNDYDGIKYILSSDNFHARYEEYENFKK